MEVSKLHQLKRIFNFFWETNNEIFYIILVRSLKLSTDIFYFTWMPKIYKKSLCITTSSSGTEFSSRFFSVSYMVIKDVICLLLMDSVEFFFLSVYCTRCSLFKYARTNLDYQKVKFNTSLHRCTTWNSYVVVSGNRKLVYIRSSLQKRIFSRLILTWSIMRNSFRD